MEDMRTVVFAPHDDGSGAFGVLLRVARALVRQADAQQLKLRIYFLNSSVAKDGQGRLDGLLNGVTSGHDALLVPTDNLIWLPKADGAVDGSRLPEVLRKWVRPMWRDWPVEPNWIRPNLHVGGREDWIDPEWAPHGEDAKCRWQDTTIRWDDLPAMTPEWWGAVDLGISMGVPQLHRVARQNGFPSVEVGDWFFSVGLRGCMHESFVPPDVIGATEPDLRMIEADEFKAREVWLTLHQAPHAEYKAHVANSPVRFNEMKGGLWTGDPRDLNTWQAPTDLRDKMEQDIAGLRGTGKPPQRIAYLVTGTTGVWKAIVGRLLATSGGDGVAVVSVDRGKGQITLLEDVGSKCRTLTTASCALKQLPSEESHLAVCRAADFAVGRSAGGVLGSASTERPAVFVDEPGHWLGRIQREQCHRAGLCTVVSLGAFKADPRAAIQRDADKLDDPDSDLSKCAEAAKQLPVDAEQALAKYFTDAYL